MKKLSFLLISLLCIFAVTPTFAAENENEVIYEGISTKFGVVEFMRPSYDIRLNGKTLVASNRNSDAEGNVLHHLLVEYYVSSGPEKIPEKDAGRVVNKKSIDRFIISEAVDGNCARWFYVLDFRGSKPFVSEKFGYNPDGKFCLAFSKVKWGKKESYIYLNDSLKYLYSTGGDVFGPVE